MPVSNAPARPRARPASAPKQSHSPTQGKGGSIQAKTPDQIEKALEPDWTRGIAKNAGAIRDRVGEPGQPTWRPLQRLMAELKARFKKGTKVPKSGERGTVGGFNDDQLKVIYELFWKAPPGAEREDIARLCKQHKEFKGTRVDRERLDGLIRYRPDSFPFGWSDRKKIFCSYVAVDALEQTPNDVGADTVMAAIAADKEMGGFMSEVALRRYARTAWGRGHYAFVKDSKLNKHGKGYSFSAVAEQTGLERFGGKLKLTKELGAIVTELCADERVRYDWDFDRFMKFISEEVGEPFEYGKWKHLREQVKGMPDWYDVENLKRARFAKFIKEEYDAGDFPTAGGFLQHLHDVHGYPLYDTNRLATLRAEFPFVPNFREAGQADRLGEAEQFLRAVEADDKKLTYDQVGETLGFDHNRVKLLMRLININWPGKLPKRKAPNTPYTAAERKIMKEALEDVPIGSTLRDVWNLIGTQNPEFFERHPLASEHELGRVLKRELGINNFRQHQQERLRELFIKVAKDADRGVFITEIVEHMRNEYDCRYGYNHVKVLVRGWKKNTRKYKDFTQLKVGGKYPWEVSVELTEELAERVGEVLRKHPNKSQREHVGILTRNAAFRRDYPTFGPIHIIKLRQAFPEHVPYIDEIRQPQERKKLAAWNGKLDKLADKLEQEVGKMHDTRGLTIAALARRVKVAEIDVRSAIVRNPERFSWYRRRPTGAIDLELAYRVGEAMDNAPLGATLSDVVRELKGDPAFDERYPSFSKMTISTLRDIYPDEIPDFLQRDFLLRSCMIQDALRFADPKTSFDQVIRNLQKAHPGEFTGKWADEDYVARLWQSNPRRYGFVEDYRNDRGRIRLKGLGIKPPAFTMTVESRAAKLARLTSTPDRLELLDVIENRVKDRPLDSGQRYEYVCVQHLLDTQIPTFGCLKRLGMSPNRTTIIGVPYSSSDLVVDALRDKGWDVRTPPLDMEQWVEEIREALYERLESALDHGRDIVVMDDGGIVSKLVSEDPILSQHANRFRVVEQTTRGITVADSIDLKSVLINVAQSWAKFVEGPMIAKSVEDKLMERLERLGIDAKKLNGKKIGIVGGGTIGLPIAKTLQSLGAKVEILDPDDTARSNAKGAKIKSTTDREGFFSDKEIVLGSTGKNGITAEDLQWLPDGCIIGSTSSKLVEIDVEALVDMSRDTNGEPDREVIHDGSVPPTLRYTLNDGREITLLAKGYPLNFDGQQENIPPEQIQLTRSLMVMGLLQATGSKVAGIKAFDSRLQLELLEAFREMGGASGNPDTEKALATALVALRRSVKRPGSTRGRRG